MKKSSLEHEQTSISTTVKDQVVNDCFLVDETINELINPKAFHFQVKSDSSVSFFVRYQRILRITHQNLEGHKLRITYGRPNLLKIEHKIPKQYLVSQETCLVHVMIVLSEFRLPPSIQEQLVRYISTEAVDFNSRRSRGEGGGRRGFRVEVNVQVNVDRCVGIRCCNSCEVEARELKEMNCAICLMELASMVSRMELKCCHVFHSDCVLKWLNKNPSCPTCRVKTLGETAYVF